MPSGKTWTSWSILTSSPPKKEIALEIILQLCFRIRSIIASEVSWGILLKRIKDANNAPFEGALSCDRQIFKAVYFSCRYIIHILCTNFYMWRSIVQKWASIIHKPRICTPWFKEGNIAR